MKFANVHRILANATEQFCLKMFEGTEMKDITEKALDKTGKWHKRECPLKAPFVIWFVVVLAIFRSKSIEEVMKELMRMLREKEPDLPQTPVTAEATIHARERLGVEPLQEVFELTAAQNQPEPTFHGLRVWGIDGVDFTLQDTAKNVEFFGRPGASRGVAAFPKMKAVALVSANTHQIRDCVFAPYKASERVLAEKLLKHLGSADLLLEDRGFPSISLLERYLQTGFHFLVRINANWKPKILKNLGPGDNLVEVSGKLSTDKYKRNRKGKKRQVWRTIKLKLRLIEYRIGDKELVRLVTDLLDPEVYPALELAIFYHQRWENELSYDELKTHLVTVNNGTLDTDFRSKTPVGVLQEAYGMLIAYNLIRGLMVEAAALRQISPLEISFVGTLEVIKSTIPQFEAASLLRYPYLTRRLLNDIAESLIDRPRRKRIYPRKVKVKMSNFHLKRPSDKGERRDLQAELQMVA